MAIQSTWKWMGRVLCVTALCLSNGSQAHDTSKGFDVEVFDDRLSKTPTISISPKDLIEEQRRLSERQARGRIDRLRSDFEWDERMWQNEVRQMRIEMDEVIRAARKDGPIYSWAAAFDLLGSLAISYAEFRAVQDAASTRSESKTGRSDDQSEGSSVPPIGDKPHYQFSQQNRQQLEWCERKDVGCRVIEYREVIQSMIIPDSSGEGSVGSGHKIEEDFIREGVDFLRVLPKPLRCIESEERCFGIDSTTDADVQNLAISSDVKGEFGDEAVYNGDSEALEKMSPVELKGRDTISSNAGLEKQVFSFLTDLIPGVGTAKGGLEFYTGQDPVTGEPVNRWIAAAGFVGGAFPGGRLYVKGAAKAGATAIRYVKVRLRHYTSRTGSDGVLKDGVLRAGKYGKIHTESANRRLLPRKDAVERYGLRQNRGQDVIEFNPKEGQLWYSKKNPYLGVEEIIVEGDVPLGPGAKVLQRD